MKGLIQAPGENRVSGTKLSAWGLMALPVLKEFLGEGGPDLSALADLDQARLLQVGLFLLGVAFYRLRKAMPNLDKLLESYQGIHARLAQVQEERDEERRKRESAEAFYQELQQELEKRPLLRRGDVRADDPPPQEPE